MQGADISSFGWRRGMIAYDVPNTCSDASAAWSNCERHAENRVSAERSGVLVELELSAIIRADVHVRWF